MSFDGKKIKNFINLAKAALDVAIDELDKEKFEPEEEEKEKKEERKEEENKENVTLISTNVDISLLAKRLAESYITKHPEYGVNSQFNNIKSMVNSDKITFLIGWIRKNNIEGLENFFNQHIDFQRGDLNKALDFFEQEIKDILTKRFSA